MFQIVAVPFDAFQALPSPAPLAADVFQPLRRPGGKAFPSLRQLAQDARMSLASVSRYMTALEQLEVFQRQRRPGGRYRYQLAEAYRPRWPGHAGRGVSAATRGCFKG